MNHIWDLGRSGVVRTVEESLELDAIHRLLRAYSDVITRRAFLELHELFAPDVAITVNTGGPEPLSFVGVDAFVTFVTNAVAKFDFFEFVLLNAVVDCEGDRAWSRMHMCEQRHSPGEHGWSTAYGRYEDEFVKVDGRWWFATRSYSSMARTGPVEAIFTETS